AMYVLLGVLLVSRLLAYLWVGKLSAARQCNRLTAEVGDRVKVSVTVRNAARLPVPWVLLEDLLPREALNPRAPRPRLKGRRGQRWGDVVSRPGWRVRRLLRVRLWGEGGGRLVGPAPPLPRRRRAALPPRLPQGVPADRVRPGVAAAHRRRAHHAPAVRGPDA